MKKNHQPSDSGLDTKKVVGLVALVIILALAGYALFSIGAFSAQENITEEQEKVKQKADAEYAKVSVSMIHLALREDLFENETSCDDPAIENNCEHIKDLTGSDPIFHEGKEGACVYTNVPSSSNKDKNEKYVCLDSTMEDPRPRKSYQPIIMETDPGREDRCTGKTFTCRAD